MKENIIKVSHDGVDQRVDNYLFKQLKHLARPLIYKAIRKGEVRVNKGRRQAHSKLQLHDLIRVPPQFVKNATSTQPIKITSSHQSLSDQIIYEDAYLVIFNKPAGWAVHGGSRLKFGFIDVIKQLDPRFKNAELVHRLDKETSGCLIIAKQRSALVQLHALLREGKVTKTYLALVEGKFKGTQTLTFPLERYQQSQGERKVYVHHAGKPSETIIKAVQQTKYGTLVQALPLTGRTHQIRVHLAHAGYPIAADQKYGNPDYNKQLKRIGLTRLFLHAHKLKFINPCTNEEIAVEAPPPNSLNAIIEL